MDKDIFPELIKSIQDDFERAYGKSEVVRKSFEALKSKKATYTTVNDFAIEIGEILSKALGASLSADKLPDGKLYYNIAKRLLEGTLGRNYELVSSYASDVQKQLNERTNIHLKTQIPALNQDRIDGIVNRVSSEQDFDDIKWILQDPIVNFTQSIVDDSIEKNAEFHHKAGLQPEVVRKSVAKCCDWCQEVQGIYKYPRVPKDIYRRHQRCRCIVDYDPKNGKVQDVWSKIWRKQKDSDKIKERKGLNKEENISVVRKSALQHGIKVNPIKRSKVKKTEEAIIKAVGGGDQTKGSCSSLALAYIGNKAGFDVLDYRDGKSRTFFASMLNIKNISELPSVHSHVVADTNDFTAVKKLIGQMQDDKEYYLATGKHAAIVRKKEGRFQYLELQAPFEGNGFKPITNAVLKERFGCQRSHSVYGQKLQVPNVLIDSDSLGENEEFQKILGFINTKKGQQNKGDKGYVK